jgi:DNA-nicking Smr family endonuclease
MAGSRKIPDEDLQLWRRAMAGVKPLHPIPPEPAKPPAPKAGPAPEPASAEKPASAHKPARPDRPTTQLPQLAPGSTPGIDRRTAERLRRGKLAIDARLDLHGMRQAEAHAELAGFVEASYQAGRRTLLIITGKGTMRQEAGVLRNQLPRWLNEPRLRHRVLSVQTAQPRHGGEGAFYVLLRRMKGG